MNKYENHITKLGGSRSIWEDEPFDLSESSIENFEKQLNYRLPADYREFLKDFGDYDVSAIYPLEYGLHRLRYGQVSLFFGLKFHYNWHLWNWYEFELSHGYIPRGLLPIASKSSGGLETQLVCLFLGKQRRGQIHLLTRKYTGNPSSVNDRFLYDESNLYFIANSFDEFMQLLVSYEDTN